MLSIGAVKSSGQATSYYEKDDYYAKDSPEAQRESAWWGKGAAALGLEGEVDREQFQKILAGELPNGAVLGRVDKDGNREHRPGWDLTFSAPKSVSLVAEAGGDARVNEAHQKAVETALSYLEHNAAQARVRQGAVVEGTPTDNLVVARFNHDTSRALDPQLHTHCVVVNATERADGEWRSLDSHPLYQKKMLAGAIYRAELAHELVRLGYQVEKTHSDGRFELAGVPKEVRDQFSNRREQIVKSLQDRGLDTAKAAAVAALNTREGKVDVDRTLLRGAWRDQVARLDFDLNQVIDHARANEGAGPSAPHQAEVADRAVSFAAQVLSEREAVFEHDDLVKGALGYAPGTTTQAAVEQAIDRAADRSQDAPLLVSAQKKEGQFTRDGWTTPAAMDLERESISLMRQGQGAAAPMLSADEWQHFAESRAFDFTPGQKAAADMILTAPDRVVGVQGYAGTGKTFMLNAGKEAVERNKTSMLSAVRELLEGKAYTVKGFAPSAAAAKQLQDATGIPSNTVASHLAGIRQGADSRKGLVDLVAGRFRPKELWIVDEASMLSNRQMRDLMRGATAAGARVALVGDTKQLGAIESGKPFELLQRAGLRTAIMRDILRQKDEMTLSAVGHAVAGLNEQAVERLGENVREIEGKEARLKAIADHYLSLSPEERAKTLVLAPANEDRQALNDHIREGLRFQQALTGPPVEASVLQDKGLTDPERGRAEHYEPGDVVRFGRDYRSLGVKKGEYWTVQGIDKAAGTVHLWHEGRETAKTWAPDKVAGRNGRGVEVYRQDPRELAAGDSLRWTRNDKNRGIRNAEGATILSVDGHHARVRLNDGKEVTLDLKDMANQHWDHAYAVTDHAGQGKTADRVLINAESFRKHLMHQRSFYVEISRAKYDAHLYTDSKKDLLKALDDRTGEKQSALEGRKRQMEANRAGRRPARERAPLPDVRKQTDRQHAEARQTPQTERGHSRPAPEHRPTKTPERSR